MLKNMKIGKKLILSFIFVSLLASISGIVSMFVIRSTNREHEYALTNYGFSQGDIGKAMLAVTDTNRCVRDVIGFTDAGDIDKAKQKMDENGKQYETYLAAVEKTLTSDRENAQFEKIKTARAAFKSKRDEVLAVGDTTDPAESKRAQKMAVEELDPLYDELYAAWSGLMDMNVETGNEMNQELNTQGTVSLIISLVLTIAALIISILLGIGISRSVSKPIGECVDRLVLLEQGDLTTPVPEPTSQDETGTLLRTLKNTTQVLSAIINDTGSLLENMAGGNFNVRTSVEEKYVGDFKKLLMSIRKMNIDMSSTLSQIDQAADQVSSGSEQVSSGAQALSQGATEQASSVEELAATINEISGQVKKTADNAEEAHNQTDLTGSEVSLCNEQMQAMIGAMKEINDRSSEIGKIIKTIEDIAFQTNILALNAAVEAARAGEAGKGFAVVADEVRNLASKSAEASKNTSSLIEGSTIAVEKGMKIADETAESLGKVVASTQDVSRLVDQIATAATEQADSISQVSQGVDQISSVVQTNSATAEESAAASEELSGQSRMLKDLVGRFTLRQEQTSSFAPAEAAAPAYSDVQPVKSAPTYMGGSDSKY